MTPAETRRQFLLGAAAALAACACSSATTPPAAPSSMTSVAASPLGPAAVVSADIPLALTPIEQKTGGRLGVYALNVETGKVLEHRAEERFAMCSTFKWLLAAQLLTRVDAAELKLDERIKYGSADLLEYAPTAKEHLNDGSMTLEELARAAVTVSDNTATNLLLAKLGGPHSLTQFALSLADVVTRLDRNEPSLNTNEPNDPRDTTTPRAMVELMHQVLLGRVLAPASRERLLGWMRACETGKNRLRAGLPADWSVGDKTGTGENGACNDVALVLPASHGSILIACYISEAKAPLQILESAHADVAREVARSLKA
jgi:beta-lactamase class A